MGKESRKKTIWEHPFLSSFAKTEHVTMPEQLIGYLIGPFGALLSSGIFTSILQNYFTDVMKLDLAFLTSLQLFSTILIVAANLVVGQVIERTHTLAGKARPWILLSALTISVTSVLMFIVPFEGTARLVWITVAYILYYAVANPIYNTANSVLVSLSTRRSDERGVLASMTNIAGLGVISAGSMIFPMLVSYTLKDDQRLWAIAMLAVAIFSVLTIYLQFRFTRERVTEETMKNNGPADHDGPAAPSVGRQLRAAAGEKSWWIVMIFYLFFQWSGALKNGSMTYYCKWVLDNSFFGSADAWGASQSLLAVLGAVPMAAAVFVINPLCRRYGKRLVCSVGMFLGAAGGAIAMAGSGNIVPVAVGIVLKCLGSAPTCFMILAILADVIDHIEYKTGIRTDGLTMSVYSSILVAGTPIMNSAFSAILALTGYDQNASVALGTAAQSALTRTAITLSYIGAETIAYALCGILILFFTVEKNLPDEQAEIARRQERA